MDTYVIEVHITFDLRGHLDLSAQCNYNGPSARSIAPLVYRKYATIGKTTKTLRST